MRSSLAELGSVADFVNGAAFKPEDWGDEGSRIIRIQNLTDPSKPYNRTTRPVTEKLYVEPGDLLVSWSASLGVFEWEGPDVGVLNQHIFRVIPDERRVDKRFLRHVLETALSQMRRHLHGATMQHVNRGEFLSTKIYLPSVLEQRRIAELLDRAEALRAKRRAAIAQLDTLTQAIFLDMFGDPVANHKGWEVSNLSDVATKITDGTHKTPTYTESGVPFLSAKDLKEGRIDWNTGKHISRDEHLDLIRRCKAEQGDVLLAKSGSLGTVAIVDRGGEFSLFESLCLIKQRRDLIEGTYLVHALRCPTMQALLLRKNKGIAVKHLHLVDIRDTEIPIPPLHQQHEFGQRVAAIEHLIQMGRTSLSALEGLFGSLQSRAFSGEL